MDYKNLTFSALLDEMSKFNNDNGIKHKCDIKDGIKMIAKVVMKQSIIREDLQEYYASEENRTLYFTNYEKALCSEDMGFSIFASNKYTTERIEHWCNEDFELCQIIEINGKEVK